MFKTTDKISKAIELLRKATEELKEDRKDEALNVIHDLTILQSNCFADLKKEPQLSDS